MLEYILATLILCGSTISPYFARHYTFQLEGEPSDLIETDVIKIFPPLYKMICLEIPIFPPYSLSGEYEIWYSTIQPLFNGNYENLLS